MQEINLGLMRSLKSTKRFWISYIEPPSPPKSSVFLQFHTAYNWVPFLRLQIRNFFLFGISHGHAVHAYSTNKSNNVAIYNLYI